MANFLSFGKAALAMECNPLLSPSGSKRAKEYRLLLQLVSYSLTLNALPKREGVYGLIRVPVIKAKLTTPIMLAAATYLHHV
ncbi:MAG: hypothetical protein DMF74_15350 [Acidobacteria bacterium]|nr:MAG: hypothetical protein DMF74_15350 [Acidobacteriota bacterium]